MSNIREIPTEPDKLLGVAEQMKRQRSSLSAAFEQLAILKKASYDAHVAAGFTPSQALELIKDYGNPSNKV